MGKSQGNGQRFEEATRKLVAQIFPLLGFEIIGHPTSQHSGPQAGFDLKVEARPLGSDVTVRFFIECKGASSVVPYVLGA